MWEVHDAGDPIPRGGRKRVTNNEVKVVGRPWDLLTWKAKEQAKPKQVNYSLYNERAKLNITCNDYVLT